MVGSFSIGLALLTYLYKKRQDELLATIDQITFFREKIIPEWDKLQKQIKQKDPSFVFSRIRLMKPTIEDIRRDFPENFKRQISEFLDSQKNYPDIYLDGPILDGHITLLNMLEEFSLRAINLKTSKNLAFISLHNAFIEIVENNAVSLIFMRDIKTCNPIYSGILKLYISWVNKIKKPTFIIKGLELHGLVSKKQREDFYKRRKEKHGF